MQLQGPVQKEQILPWDLIIIIFKINRDYQSQNFDSAKSRITGIQNTFIFLEILYQQKSIVSFLSNFIQICSSKS